MNELIGCANMFEETAGRKYKHSCMCIAKVSAP